MLTARDVMTTDLVTIRPDSTVSDAIEALLQHSISGMPVTAASGELLGVISEYAMLVITYEPEVRDHPVRNYLTRDVITVSEDAPLSEIADLFILHRIRRLPVTRNGRLVGLISRRDVLRAGRESTVKLCTLSADSARFAAVG